MIVCEVATGRRYHGIKPSVVGRLRSVGTVIVTRAAASTSASATLAAVGALVGVLSLLAAMYPSHLTQAAGTPDPE